ELRDRDVWSGVDLVGGVCGPGIDRREILAAAHLRNVGEHVQPEGVIAAQERALARTQVVGEPQRDSTLAPGLPRRIRSESRLHAEPRRQADRDEGGERARMNPRVYRPSEKRTVSGPSLVRLGHFLGAFVAGPFAIAIPKRKTATPSAPMRLVSATATGAATAIASRHADGARR